MTKLNDLANLGQSIWIDYIRRSFIESGEMQALIDQGVRGVTSNPAIFEKAIAHSDDYDEQMRELVLAGKSVEEIYDALAVRDIRAATDLFRPVYESTHRLDGYVSLEVSPNLANDTAGTIAEARRYYQLLDRPNLMIKVPATAAGIPAVETLISEGINVNITLMFSMDHYVAVAEAYLRGLERLAEAGGDLSKVNSVASFFISRVDSMLDPMLEAAGAADLKGKIAIANAKLVYQRFKAIFSGERWDRLAAQGAHVQRPLWASTSTKDPAYPDTLYVDTLIGPYTVNTLPPETLTATLDHGRIAISIEDDLAEAQAQIDRLRDLGIDLDAVTEKLQAEGVDKFVQPFSALLGAVSKKRDAMRAEPQSMAAQLGGYQGRVDRALSAMAEARVIERIWARDHTVWNPSPDEITNRLDWLIIADEISGQLDEIRALVRDVQAEGYTHALLLGMGGSSLAPEVFALIFGAAAGHLDLKVLDSTDPGAVLNYERTLDPAHTLYIVSTKSGGTVETVSFFKYFYNRAAEAVGREAASAHFIAITDAGSGLEKLAQEYNFRHIFHNNPHIGGRYSALSHFGIVPAALLGVDIERLLARAQAMARGCGPDMPVADNPGAWLGAILGEMARAGRDKVTFIISPPLEPFGGWVEQLIAESTGKEGRGIVPVVGERLGSAPVYAEDRLFVYLKLEGDDTHDVGATALEDSGQPVVRLTLRDVYDLGGQFFLWELAVAVAGARLEIQPFDQPNVESAKVVARRMVDAYISSGSLPDQTPALQADGLRIYGDIHADDLTGALRSFFAQGAVGDYIALQAYITPGPEADSRLATLQTRLRDRYRLATTVGYGPRFLHSTGQLHKGDRGNGLFLQFTNADEADTAIPDKAGESASAMSFGILKLAQALGDAEALRENHRRVMRIDLGADPLAALDKVLAAL